VGCDSDPVVDAKHARELVQHAPSVALEYLLWKGVDHSQSEGGNVMADQEMIEEFIDGPGKHRRLRLMVYAQGQCLEPCAV
jgi:hypothetical protein